jgi:hypothetical protein
MHNPTLEQMMLLQMIKDNAPEIKKAIVYLLALASKESGGDLPCCPMILFNFYCLIEDM